jgi:cell division FtsZ-interacting protein ZapD
VERHVVPNGCCCGSVCGAVAADTPQAQEEAQTQEAQASQVPLQEALPEAREAEEEYDKVVPVRFWLRRALD